MDNAPDHWRYHQIITINGRNRARLRTGAKTRMRELPPRPKKTPRKINDLKDYSE